MAQGRFILRRAGFVHGAHAAFAQLRLDAEPSGDRRSDPFHGAMRHKEVSGDGSRFTDLRDGWRRDQHGLVVEF